ncbi:MAG: hypothetical protein ABI724_19640 [Betaproteobacteria bacterium]
MKGQLNLFQVAMLRWRAIHPYNAVHVIRIDQPLDAKRLATAIDATLEQQGLAGYSLDVSRERYEYAGGPGTSTLEVLAGADDPLQVLRSAIERELNRPFPRDGPFVPFRFFVVDEGPRFHLAMTYDHVIAGGDSIVVLMRDLFAAYTGREESRRAQRQRYPATCARLFRQQWGAALRGIRRLGEMAASCRRSVRPRYPRGADPANAFVNCRIDPPEFAALLRAAKAWGVTVNDLLMAILLRVLEPHAGERPETERRRELAVASIVNLRRDFGYDANTTFGQFLSSFRVAHLLPPGMELRQLAQDVHAETERIKRDKLYLANLVAIGVIGAVWRFLSPAQRQGFYAKNYAAWGAITMVNVDPLWSGAGGPLPPPEYLRAVSTGPLTPLVIAVTTAAGTLNAGISYRTAAFAPAVADTIASGIVDAIRRLS